MTRISSFLACGGLGAGAEPVNVMLAVGDELFGVPGLIARSGEGCQVFTYYGKVTIPLRRHAGELLGWHKHAVGNQSLAPILAALVGHAGDVGAEAVDGVLLQGDSCV